ncbi:hypothetical protein ABZZ80_40700 [Streptomyces sp. NPDC006356]
MSVLARPTRSSAETVAAVLAGLTADGTVKVRTVGTDSRYLLAPSPLRRVRDRKSVVRERV